MSSNIRKRRIYNIIVDALSKRYVILSHFDFHIFERQTIEEQFVHDDDFKDIMYNCKYRRIRNKYMKNNVIFV